MHNKILTHQTTREAGEGFKPIEFAKFDYSYNLNDQSLLIEVEPRKISEDKIWINGVLLSEEHRDEARSIYRIDLGPWPIDRSIHIAHEFSEGKMSRDVQIPATKSLTIETSVQIPDVNTLNNSLLESEETKICIHVDKGELEWPEGSYRANINYLLNINLPERTQQNVDGDLWDGLYKKTNSNGDYSGLGFLFFRQQDKVRFCEYSRSLFFGLPTSSSLPGFSVNRLHLDPYIELVSEHQEGERKISEDRIRVNGGIWQILPTKNQKQVTL